MDRHPLFLQSQFEELLCVKTGWKDGGKKVCVSWENAQCGLISEHRINVQMTCDGTPDFAMSFKVRTKAVKQKCAEN